MPKTGQLQSCMLEVVYWKLCVAPFIIKEA